MMPEELKNHKVSLAVVMFVLLFAAAAWQWVDMTFARASDVRKLEQRIDVRLLTQQQRTLETAILRLTLKREVYPARFDAVDKTLLEQQQEQLREVQKDMRQAKTR